MHKYQSGLGVWMALQSTLKPIDLQRFHVSVSSRLARPMVGTA